MNTGVKVALFFGAVFLVSALLNTCVNTDRSANSASAVETPSRAPRVEAPPQEIAPPHQLQVISFRCIDSSRSYDRASVTVRNTGKTTIMGATIYVTFRDKAGNVTAAGNSVISPIHLAPGAIGSAEVLERKSGAATCSSEAFQDAKGVPIIVSSNA